MIAENDLNAAGKVTAFRPMIAYPPFVFNAAANRAASTMRYTVSNAIVPDAGCTATPNVIRFRLSP